MSKVLHKDVTTAVIYYFDLLVYRALYINIIRWTVSAAAVSEFQSSSERVSELSAKTLRTN